LINDPKIRKSKEKISCNKISLPGDTLTVWEKKNLNNQMSKIEDLVD